MTAATEFVTPLDRPLPQSNQAERAVLGSILINNDAFSRVVPIISGADYFREAHKIIWASMERFAQAGNQIDLLTLKEDLAGRGLLERVGGSAYISSLVDGIPDVANVERYAKIVLEKSLFRALIIEGNQLMRNALEPNETAVEIASASALRLTDLTSTRLDGPTSVRVTARRAAADVEARSATGEHITGIPFGLEALDACTLGIQRGVESMLAARPRVGKTAFALAIAVGAAKAGFRTLVIELDMSERMIGKRLLSMESGVSYEKIRSGQFISSEEWQRIANAEARLADLDGMLMFDYGTSDLPKIIAMVRREARQKLDLVIVDHIGHIRGGQGRERYLQLGDVSSRFIGAAKETNAAWLSLVQLGRDSEHREPYLSDLRESGNLEQDARLIVLLDRPFLREEAGYAACRINLHVAKNEGEAGMKLEAHFDGDVQTVSQDVITNCRYCRGTRNQ